MKNFLSSRTWEDWIIYSIIALMIIGGILFVVGFFFSFNNIPEGYDDLENLVGKHTFKTSIMKLIKGTDGVGNLFSMMTYQINGEGIGISTSAYNMCAVAISGVSILLFSALIIIGILIWGGIAEFIIPKIKGESSSTTVEDKE